MTIIYDQSKYEFFVLFNPKSNSKEIVLTQRNIIKCPFVIHDKMYYSNIYIFFTIITRSILWF